MLMIGMSKRLVWVSLLLWILVSTELAVITHNLWWSMLDAGGIAFFIILVEYRKRQLAKREKQNRGEECSCKSNIM